MAGKLKQGEDKTLTLGLYDANGNPYSLVGATEITALLPLSSGLPLSKTLTGGGIVVTSAAYGKMTLTLSDTETLTLRAGDNQDIEIWIDVGSNRSICQIKGQLSIVKSTF